MRQTSSEPEPETCQREYGATRSLKPRRCRLPPDRLKPLRIVPAALPALAIDGAAKVIGPPLARDDVEVTPEADRRMAARPLCAVPCWRQCVLAVLAELHAGNTLSSCA